VFCNSRSNHAGTTVLRPCAAATPPFSPYAFAAPRTRAADVFGWSGFTTIQEPTPGRRARLSSPSSAPFDAIRCGQSIPQHFNARRCFVITVLANDAHQFGIDANRTIASMYMPSRRLLVTSIKPAASGAPSIINSASVSWASSRRRLPLRCKRPASNDNAAS
jgi:hypothetical protein